MHDMGDSTVRWVAHVDMHRYVHCYIHDAFMRTAGGDLPTRIEPTVAGTSISPPAEWLR